jgi:hypothetical protein
LECIPCDEVKHCLFALSFLLGLHISTYMCWPGI